MIKQSANNLHWRNPLNSGNDSLIYTLTEGLLYYYNFIKGNFIEMTESSTLKINPNNDCSLRMTLAKCYRCIKQN